MICANRTYEKQLGVQELCFPPFLRTLTYFHNNKDSDYVFSLFFRTNTGFKSNN